MYKIGQWYQYKNFPNEFRKCSQERTDKLCFSEKITHEGLNKKTHKCGNDWGNYSFNEDNCIPVDISVIAKYLPEGHPDLLKLNTVIELW
jgi:hypothetical protein